MSIGIENVIQQSIFTL